MMMSNIHDKSLQPIIHTCSIHFTKFRSNIVFAFALLILCLVEQIFGKFRDSPMSMYILEDVKVKLLYSI